MQVFQRLKRALSSSIDALLDDVENHEAVVTATIHEVEGSALLVANHRKTCEQRIEALQQRALALDGELRQWRERARRLRDEREKALECVRRLRATAAMRKDAIEELAKQRELHDALCADDRAIAAKLDELRRRSAQLASRQARTEVDGIAPEMTVDGVLGRWEARVAKGEAMRAPGRDCSPTLTQIEEAALVSAELDRLLAEEEDR